MAHEKSESADGGKLCSLYRMPFWHRGGSSSSPVSSAAAAVIHTRAAEGSDTQYPTPGGRGSGSGSGSGLVSSVARSLLPARRLLRLKPATKLYFPYEPGKQVRSAIRIKNTSKSHVAFKFQTTSPKSCFMRPPGAILSPGESIIATVFKFVELPENNEKVLDKKYKAKFKIVSLKVKESMVYVSKLFDEQKDQVAMEQILTVVFLDIKHPSPQLEKLKRLLAEADTTVEAHKKLHEDTGPEILGEELVIDEWKERRERHLAQEQVELVDSV